MGADRIILIIMAIFAAIGGIDLIFGDRLGLGQEFKKGILLMGQLFLSMSGMLVLAPFIAKLISPAVVPVFGLLGIDPAIFAGSLLACDMGGYSLAVELTNDPSAARLGGLIVSSMLGVTVTFTLPVAMGVISKEDRGFAAKGLLCGIITLPVGMLAGGLAAGCSPLFVLKNSIPIIALSAFIALGLWNFERVLIACFTAFGRIMTAVSTIGLIIATIQRLCGMTFISELTPLDEVFKIIGDIALVLAGAFPLMLIVTKLLRIPLNRLGSRIGVNEHSIKGLLTSLVNSIPAFDSLKDMDDRGKVINMAFSVSGAFVFGDHLAFTAGVEPSAIPALIVSKLTAGLCALLVAMLVTKKSTKKGRNTNV